jgi:hypothetical protein
MGDAEGMVEPLAWGMLKAWWSHLHASMCVSIQTHMPALSLHNMMWMKATME